MQFLVLFCFLVLTNALTTTSKAYDDPEARDLEDALVVDKAIARREVLKYIEYEYAFLFDSKLSSSRQSHNSLFFPSTFAFTTNFNSNLRSLILNRDDGVRDREELFHIDHAGVTDALDYMLHYMPKSDCRQLGDPKFIALLGDNIVYAEIASTAFPWTVPFLSKKETQQDTPTQRKNVERKDVGVPLVPFLLYLNEVVPYRTLTEPHDNSRKMFFNILLHCAYQNATKWNSKSLNENLGLEKVEEAFGDFALCLQTVNITSENIPYFLATNMTLLSAKNVATLTTLLNSLNEGDFYDAGNMALWGNKVAWGITSPPIVFKASSANELNSYGVFDVIKEKQASCTGLALFLVSFYRAIGIPARTVGVPHWNKGSDECPNGDADDNCGNHNWVEVWVGGKWHFIDQRGLTNLLDTGWFYPDLTELQSIRTTNHSIFASSYAPSKELKHKFSENFHILYPKHFEAKYFPLVWDFKNTSVNAWDVTMRYRRRT